MTKQLKTLLFILLFSITNKAQVLDLPPRPAEALSGSELAELVRDYNLTDRENEIYAQILNGNVPNFLRNLVPITFNQTLNNEEYEITYYVIPDYLAVGADTNYFLIPMTPILAQKICNQLNFTLPTRKMVDQIWSNATVKLIPSPIPPSPAMTTIPVMWQHNQIVWEQREAEISQHPLGEMVAGNKKDIVISNSIYGNSPPNRVVIYGWHYQNGIPIQPLYSGHGETYADYSHGVRLVQDSILINGKPGKITEILKSNTLFPLFSDEGKIPLPYYPLEEVLRPPSGWGILSKDKNSLELFINGSPDITHYKVHLSKDGKIFTSSILLEKDNLIITGLLEDTTYFIKLQAISTDTSLFSEVLAGIPSESEKKCLIVNGFDRPYTGNTYDFIRMHSKAINENGYSFESATNEAVTYGLINLGDYNIVDWILGAESTADESLNNTEQAKVSSFLNNGGSLFVSGSEIAWDLDYKGTTNDKNFFLNYLKSKYVYDAPNNQSNTFYKAEGVDGSIFEGLTQITFDNGTKGTYNVSYPDVINGFNGGINAIKYSGLTNNYAGIVYKGKFLNGSEDGGLVYLGFPFETIYPEETGIEVMRRVLNFFENLTTVEDLETNITTEYVLYQNYPNPFNPKTTIKFTIPSSAKHQLSETISATVKVYDSLGSQVAILLDEDKKPGTYQIEFDATGLSSGIYYYQLNAGNYITTKPMVLLK